MMDNTDDELNTDNDFKKLINDEYLEKVATTIENKLSIGIIEKRRSYFMKMQVYFIHRKGTTS